MKRKTFDFYKHRPYWECECGDGYYEDEDMPETCEICGRPLDY